jgi:hypothetical protein
MAGSAVAAAVYAHLETAGPWEAVLDTVGEWECPKKAAGGHHSEGGRCDCRAEKVSVEERQGEDRLDHGVDAGFAGAHSVLAPEYEVVAGRWQKEGGW